MTDLERFDTFAENVHEGLDVRGVAIGGFLPGRQFYVNDHVITFFFGDDGSFTDIAVVNTRD